MFKFYCHAVDSQTAITVVKEQYGAFTLILRDDKSVKIEGPYLNVAAGFVATNNGNTGYLILHS